LGNPSFKGVNSGDDARYLAILQALYQGTYHI